MHVMSDISSYDSISMIFSFFLYSRHGIVLSIWSVASLIFFFFVMSNKRTARNFILQKKMIRKKENLIDIEDGQIIFTLLCRCPIFWSVNITKYPLQYWSEICDFIRLFEEFILTAQRSILYGCCCFFRGFLLLSNELC